MAKKRRLPSHLPAVLDTLLRRWWWIYLTFGLFTLLVDLIQTFAQKGPSGLIHYFDQYSYLAHFARAFPTFFWTTFGILTVAALFGLFLNILDWWNDHHRYDRLRTLYLGAVYSKYQYIPLVVDESQATDLHLPDLVYQTLTFHNGTTGTPDGTHATTIQRTVEDVASIPSNHYPKSIVILGAPGSGKTTLLRHSMREAARSAIASRSRFPPIFLTLPRFAPLLNVSPDTALAEYLKKYESALVAQPEYADVLQEMLIQRGEVLLFLDGLDEVDPGLHRTVIDWINSLSLHPNSIIVIGTRFTDYVHSNFSRLDFDEWSAQPMNKETQEKLAANLLNILYNQLVAEQRHQQSPPQLDMFVSQLWEHPSGKFWSGNPLLFSLAAYVYVHDAGQLPPSRVALYSRSIHALLAKVVRAEQVRDTRARSQGVHSDIRLVLSEVAFRLFTQENFTEQDLIGPLRKIREVWSLPYSEGIMSKWVINSGTVEPAGQEQSFRFRHHTFREYLAALALAQRIIDGRLTLRQESIAFLRAHRQIGAWFEPLRMLAGVMIMETETYQVQERALLLDWLHELRMLALPATGLGDDTALELSVAMLSEIPNLESAGLENDANALLLGWAEALLRLAQSAAEPLPMLARLQRLNHDVSLLPRSVAQPALDRLMSALDDDSLPHLQAAAAQALGGMGDLVPIRPLISVLRRPCDSRARSAAAHALIRLEYTSGEHPGHPVLQEGLTSQDVILARLIAAALSTADQSGRELMMVAVKQRDIDVRRLGVVALGKLEPRFNVGVLLGFLKSKHEHFRIREASAVALAQLGRVEQLIPYLSDEDPQIQRMVAATLTQIGEPAVGPLLQALSNKRDALTRYGVALALAGLGKPAVNPLIRALGDRGDPWVQQGAAMALAMPQLGTQVPIEPLIRALGDENVQVQRAVVATLTKIGESAVGPLLQALSNKRDALVRQGAALALTRLGGQAIKPLIRALGDRDPLVRQGAIQVMAHLGERAIEPLVQSLGDHDKHVQEASELALAQLGNGALEALVRALGDENKQVQQAAAEVIGRLGPAAVEPLIHALGNHDAILRGRVMQALLQLGKYSKRPLIRALSDTDALVREGASQVLDKLG